MSRARDLADSADKDIAGTLTLDDLSVSGTVTGNVTGDLTGDVTGNLTGDTIGTHTGAVNATNITVTGVVTGNVTGDILGDVKADNGTVILDSGTNGRNAEFTGDVDLSAIAATISDTAVDVFVYDTRKDSDGGAWRKRTQHTSWYNETLNTATRGSRKEFPAVAVIVAESNQVTIYDGDDPDLPMWMVFNTGGNWNHILVSTSGYVTCVAMLNGHLVIGRNLNTGWQLTKTSFVDDSSYGYKNAAHGTSDGVWTGGIVARNGDGSYYDNGVASNILSPYNNDVAMTVLPNAPIDAATGLPVPTIAVATNGGVSVIKDDGTVVDITHTASTNNGATDISFNGNQISYATQQSGSSTNYWRKAFIDIPSADVTGSYTHNISGMTVYDARGTSSNSGVVLNTNSNLGDATNDIKAAVHDAVGFTNKLTLLDVDYYSDAGTPSESGSMVAYVASDHNTGWMNGDIKLATLSDTDDTNVTGSELITNGTFDTNITGWTSTDGNISHQSGALRLQGDGSSTSYPRVYQAITTVVGKTYTVTADMVGGNAIAWYLRVDTSSGGNGNLYNSNNLTAATHAGTFTATGTTTYIILQVTSTIPATNYRDFDNVSVRLAEEDRSVNGNGLQVFGTVTKSAVATGADLVAYSGFTDSNYLLQPYNTDLQFGVGNFSIHIWMKTTGTATRYLYSNYNNSAGGGFAAYMVSNGTLNGWVNSPNTSYAVNSTRTINDGAWHLVSFIRSEATINLYIDGIFEVSGTIPVGSNLSVLNSEPLTIGNYSNSYYAWQGSLSLLRISATAPSPEQIAKIYEDEKHLFQENAQATLYGSSDAVTALAYDDSTELLHVGTSAGRSVFQGLRRVDNTTTAVGAAISASNGLVADE